MAFTFKKPDDYKHTLWAIKMPIGWSPWECPDCGGGVHGHNHCGAYPCPVFATATRLAELEQDGTHHPVPEGWIGRIFGVCKDNKEVGI